MKLTEQELRWLSRWEKRERLWLPVTRWVCVFNGVVTLVLGIFLFKKLADLGNTDAIAWFGWFAWLLVLKSGMWFGVALSKWRGDIKLRLLLRLIRESANREA